MISCDSRAVVPKLTARIVVVVVVAMYGERWLAWLPKGLKPPASSIIAGSLNTVNFSTLVSLVYLSN